MQKEIKEGSVVVIIGDTETFKVLSLREVDTSSGRRQVAKLRKTTDTFTDNVVLIRSDHLEVVSV